MGIDNLQVLSEDGELVFCRGWRDSAEGSKDALAVFPISAQPRPATLDRLTHEYSLKDELSGTWAVRPLALVRDRGRTVLVHEDPGGELLGGLLGTPMDVGSFLRIAVGIAAALGEMHQHGLIHKDIKPANVLVNTASGEVRLTGFGIASRLPRERQPPDPPEAIAGTLAYMAPEQTGRMNRSVDSRSDLYSLGVTFYQMLTGALPFAATDPMEWVHCHIARKPVAPDQRLAGIPAPLSDVVMKLLAKTSEERYQTAAGVERDLRRCLAEWTRGSLTDFPLGEGDAPDRLLIPEKLYGREREVDTLLASFDRIVKNGAPELVLVSGYSGIGKSSVVNELHKVLVPPRGLFAAGKFDQYKRDIPYATLAQAFRGLVRPLLSKSDAELRNWRDALMEALDAHGRLMTDLVPELKLIIGEQPPVSELAPQDSQRRFQQVFQRFIGVLARPEHPLALFLDDLQWLDAATLDLIEDVLTRSDLQQLILIGAYRSNEVGDDHPLRRKLNAIKAAGGKVTEITLGPLGREHLSQLIRDALRCDARRAAPFSQLVHDKTAGNPFFAIQFVGSLAEEGMLVFDHEAARWSWDLDRIHSERYTDNVVELMVGKLNRLPAETQLALQILACLGNVAAVSTLSIVLGMTEERVHGALRTAIRDQLVERKGSSYEFSHDRIHEAAYSLLPEALRAGTHLRIGRSLAANTPAEQREESVFEIVNQLNRGVGLITLREEREQLAELNLLAGRRAKASTAYGTALKYLAIGAGQLTENAWDHQHDLIFALELLRAECEFLTGELTAAETRLANAVGRVVGAVEQAAVACLRMDLYTTLDQAGRALGVGLNYLRFLGIDWSPHPTDGEVRREYERIWSQLGSRTIEELIDLPLMTDPTSLATLDVLIKLWPAAMFTDMNLFALTMCRAVNLSLEHGNSDGSCTAYVRLGAIAGSRFGDYQAALRFGRLGYDLVEQRGLKRFQARTYLLFGSLILPWTKHVTAAREVLRRAFLSAKESGDFAFAAASAGHLNANMLAASDPLVEVQREAERGLAFAQKIRFGLASDVIATQLQMARMLRGLTRKLGLFDDEQFSELQITNRFSGNPNLGYAECFYWIRKLQGCVLAGDFSAAVDASLRPRHLFWTAQSALEMAEYHFYAALARAACCELAAPEQRQQHQEALVAHYQEIETWARHCPENFANRAALVAAEIARLDGRDVEAMRLYEQAIRSARDHGFVQNEGLAYEVAARFYNARGFETFAEAYLGKARDCYLRWGAEGKVRQLDRLHPHLTAPGERRPAAAIGSPVQHLDVASVVKASQALSSEIVLPKLIERLMTIALENAGASRGLLILPLADEYLIQAEAQATGDQIEVMMRQEPITRTTCPESLVRYVIRTQESVILDDASGPSLFSGDDYLRDRQSKSILCLPLIKQRQLAGILLLENTLASHAFTPSRIAVLELLAAQAAISLENTRLYSDLQERETKVRRLVDSNIIGILIGNLDGHVQEANQAFLQIVGYDQADLAAGRLRRTELTPAEWYDRDAQAVAEMRTMGTAQPFEKEYFRKDGSRVPVLIGGATLDERGDTVVIFAVDLTERKRAEGAARESERRFREVEMELAHANRIATMGQLTASIAHEVNQPIAAALTNAGTALRWLTHEPPDLEKAKQTINRSISDGRRAADVISGIRDLVKKAPARTGDFAINEAILEVIALTHTEISKNRVLVQTELAKDMPLVQGDRVQLQQVILNLIVNAVEAMSQMSDGSRDLLISTKSEPGSMQVAVRDSGPGLPQAGSEQVFKAFYTTKPTGLGMGLSICRSIVEAHGGRLWAEPNKPRGAVFCFTLPVGEKALANQHVLVGDH
ncbi:MAG TPA: AAA family ATPase [Xanthobacteraceae bacterium]|nr:AAA family ATPase [Xanthobacteraceae bacterium]